MDRTNISRIESWDSRSVAGGYVGLNELADEGFTGAVTAGGTHLFMLNGRVVGVFDGDISAFEGADAEAYSAPDPALPLLFSMQERGGEVRGKYYTDDTPIEEVDETLTSSGFTGYLELSENVLSGDYYVVYYGGRSLSAAFVGNEGRAVTGEEAFDLAADEVGIYEVTSVDLEVTDVPEPSEDAEAAAGGAGAAGAVAASDAAGDEAAAEGVEETPDVADAEPGTEAVDDAEEVAEAADADAEEAAEAADVDAGAEADESDEADVAEESAAAEPADAEDDAVAEAEPEAASEGSDTEPEDATVETAETDDSATASSSDPGAAESISEAEPGGDAGAPDAAGEEREGGGQTRPAESGVGRPAQREEAARGEPDERFEEEARWRETATVPALDPDESAPAEAEREPAPTSREEPADESRPRREEAGPAEEATALRERIGRLETELEETERERRRLDEQLESVRADREELAEERDALEARIDELESRVEEAEAAAEAAAASADSSASGATAGSTGGRSVDPETALDQTDLFVRYGSKADPTLQTAHDGQASAEEVAGNLRIETHSRFDTNTATVDSRPFTEFLEDTIQYRFVSWLVEELLYEIQETGTEAGLRGLYDVLPELDRAEFHGTVTSYDEEGEESSESFDVVCRDRMGKPLVVGNINDSLDPATGDMMATLVEDATAAAEAHESMGAAFLVTASFFQPDALETAAEATRGGGFLSRDSKKSFVKLARSGGYHLCLVEARGDDFHVAVPEF